jgi:hypothetical protein
MIGFAAVERDPDIGSVYLDSVVLGTPPSPRPWRWLETLLSIINIQIPAQIRRVW